MSAAESKQTNDYGVEPRWVVPSGRMSNQIVRAVGWWQLRQWASRAELVEMGVTKRGMSYNREKDTAELFGVPVDEWTEANMLDWLGFPPRSRKYRKRGAS